MKNLVFDSLIIYLFLALDILFDIINKGFTFFDILFFGFIRLKMQIINSFFSIDVFSLMIHFDVIILFIFHIKMQVFL